MGILTGFISCSPLKSKRAEEVVQAYLNEVYYRFGGSRKILSDNGMGFKNKVFEEVSKKLGCEVGAYSPPYQPQSNGKIECFHVWANISVKIWSGMMSSQWLQQPTIFPHIHQARKCYCNWKHLRCNGILIISKA